MENNSKYILNPESGRYIAVGGSLHRKLIRQGRMEPMAFSSRTPTKAYNMHKTDYSKPITQQAPKPQPVKPQPEPEPQQSSYSGILRMIESSVDKGDDKFKNELFNMLSKKI